MNERVGTARGPHREGPQPEEAAERRSICQVSETKLIFLKPPKRNSPVLLPATIVQLKIGWDAGGKTFTQLKWNFTQLLTRVSRAHPMNIRFARRILASSPPPDDRCCENFQDN